MTDLRHVTEDQWREALFRFLRHAMAQRRVDYSDIAQPPSFAGEPKERVALGNKVRRSMYDPGFFLALLAAIGLPGVTLEEVAQFLPKEAAETKAGDS
ncbi:DUF6471 domain-containing protein [Nitrospirillum pindoramense]|uniref:DUF6471 domain-containing protein n=1 Tax=Nitrospirillum amazonense TaxID=28077 RepID=A0A560GVH3_9PROT|nr:DUF6471 domain-containing protein [Nitrospirillum amazonense]TWB38025.1 hypothetical protein FBZ90_11316 [Nitrospirillum amazonense]